LRRYRWRASHAAYRSPSLLRRELTELLQDEVERAFAEQETLAAG
jgi:hypothetical protein